MNQALLDYYRLPADLFDGISATTDQRREMLASFNLERALSATGETGLVSRLMWRDQRQFDASRDVRSDDKTIHFPFEFAEVVENLRRERYRQNMVPGTQSFVASKPIRWLYYLIREWMPISVRRQLQKVYLRDWRELPFPAWPVDFTVDTLHEKFLRLLMEKSGKKKVPFIWFWPDGAPNCLVMTHDVETSAGRDFTPQLIDLDATYGIKASYQVVPEQRYGVSDEYVKLIRAGGCEVNVHDLSHDGQLYDKRDAIPPKSQEN